MAHAMLAAERVQPLRVAQRIVRSLEDILQERRPATVRELIRVARRGDRVGAEHILAALRERLIRVRVELRQIPGCRVRGAELPHWRSNRPLAPL